MYLVSRPGSSSFNLLQLARSQPKKDTGRDRYKPVYAKILVVKVVKTWAAKRFKNEAFISIHFY